MKRSLVLRGFKSWVDKFHHPLPLDRRESNRLLAALKSSFRSHLDEHHPQLQAPQDEPDVRKNATSKRAQAATHSAIFAADHHMSSILTSPLLANSPKQAKDVQVVDGPDLLDIKARLNIPGTDPLQILNEFRDHPGASMAVAALCLNAFNSALRGQADAQKRKIITRRGPGIRVVLWLKATGLYGTRSMLHDNTVMTLIVPFLLIEKQEEQLWDLLSVKTGTLSDPVINDADEMHSHYRWKSTMLLRMVRFQCNRDSNYNGALTTLLRAIHQTSDGKDPWFSVIGAGQFLCARLANPRKISRTQVDADHSKYEQFIHELHTWNDASEAKRLAALLRLYHPKEPEAGSAVKYLRKLLEDNSEKEHGDRLSQLTHHLSNLTGDDLQERLKTIHELCVETGNREDARFIQSIADALGLPTKPPTQTPREAKSMGSQRDRQSGSGVVSDTLLMPGSVYG